MTLGPLWTLRPFTVGIGRPNHASLSLENTFTNFYLKDLTWSDNANNMYLGPVVVAQQGLDPSPQTSYPRKEKKGGGAQFSSLGLVFIVA